MHLQADFLVIGSGIAGLRAALTLAESGSVIVLTKADPRESNTGYAQGGIAAALGRDDSPELHAKDTMSAGDGLCNAAAVDVLTREGPKYVNELLAWGAAFDRDAGGEPALAREAAHSVRRVLHARDATGREIGRLLWSRVGANGRIRVLQGARATELIVADGVCSGARFIAGASEDGSIMASRTLLATGGAGQVFRETTNPDVATGDGIAMAAEAGARVADLEFTTISVVRGDPRRGGMAGQRGRRAVHDPLRTGRRARIARPGVASHRSRNGADAWAGLFVACAPRPSVRARTLSDDCSGVFACRA